MSKNQRSYFLRELANILSFSRLLLAGGVFYAGFHSAWVLCFWLFVFALLTDFFDGMAARKFHSFSTFGSNIDRTADFLLATAGLVVITFNAHFPLWFGLAILPIALIFASIKLFLPASNKTRLIVSMFSTPLLFLVWIIGIVGVADQAFGWTGWYLWLAAAVFLTASIIKRKRYREWFAWLWLHKNKTP